MRCWCLLLALAPLACAGRSANSERERTLVERFPVSDPARVGLGFFSHEGEGQARNHEHADDFTLPRPARVVNIQWWGLSDAAHSTGLANFDVYTVRIFAQGADGPGSVLHTWTRRASELEIQPTGRQGAGAGEASRGLEHHYKLRLSEPVRLPAGTPLYLSITAHRVDPAGDNWQWQDAEDADRIGWSRPLGEEAWQAIEDVDSAFRLVGVFGSR